MAFTPVVRDSMLNAIVGISAVVVATHASLHSALPDANGSNELAGGSPAYARRPISFLSASSGRLIKAPSPAVQFDVPAASTAAFVGLWTAPTGGAFLGYAPLSSDPPSVGVVSSSTDKVSSPGHGLLLNDRVLASAFTGMSTPPGIAPGTYFAAPVDADNFKLSATLGGLPLDPTADGVLVFQRIRIDTFSSQGTVTVSTLVLGLDG